MFRGQWLESQVEVSADTISFLSEGTLFPLKFSFGDSPQRNLCLLDPFYRFSRALDIEHFSEVVAGTSK